MFFGPSEFAVDEMGYAMSRLEIKSDLCYAGKEFGGVGSSSCGSHRSSEHVKDLDKEISQATKLKSSPHQRFSRVVPGRHQLLVATLRLLASRESNLSGRGRFYAADCCKGSLVRRSNE